MGRKIRVTIYTGFVGANHVIDHDLPDDWDELSEEEKNAELDAFAEAERDSRIEFGAEVIDDDE